MEDVVRIARSLETAGFNIVPIGADKRPLGRWSATEKLYTADDIVRLGDRVRAIAITGNYYSNGEYAVVILDVDDVDAADSVLSEVFRDWRRELCGGYDAFCGLTGPRPKGKVLCSNGICINEETGEEIPADEVKRGLYIVVRVPRSCVHINSTMRFGAVEVLYNNYQIVYGEHPSGLRYEFAKWDGRWVAVDTPGPSVILTCDEFSRLLNALKRMRVDKTETVNQLPQCKEYRQVADPQLLLGVLKRLWPARRGDGSHLHDELLFALVCVAYRRCVDGESLRSVLDELFRWAVKEGHDTERHVREHWSQTFNYVYGGKAQKLWGLKQLEDAVFNAARVLGLSEEETNELLDDILTALGAGEVHRPICVPVKYLRVVTNGSKSVTTPTVKLCNTRSGVVKIERKSGEDSEVYAVTKVVNAFIRELAIYRDAELDIEYVSAVVEIPHIGVEDVLSMARPSALERILRRRQVTQTPNWQVLIDYYPRKVDYIISGFVCSPEVDRYPCGVRDYFGTGVLQETTRDETRDVIESLINLLDRYAPSETWFKTAVTAFFHGAFQNFFFTRKLWGVRPQIVAFVGPRGTGKTTIARTLLETFFPRAVHKLFLGAASVLTPARVGRMQDNLVTTLVVIDEVESVSHKQDVYAVLKSYISNPTAWRTATGDEWPARAGIILTANALVVEDPELADKIYTVQFGDITELEKRSAFARELLHVVKQLPRFGTYYLKYAEEHWQDVKDYVLNSSAARGAELYARAIADDLGVTVELTNVSDASVVVMTAVDKYIRWLYNYVVRYAGTVKDDTMPAWRLVENALERMLLPHHRQQGSNVTILRTIQSEIMVNIRTLCEELGGRLEPQGCVVTREQLVSQFAEQ